jgi:hypothetical protein
MTLGGELYGAHADSRNPERSQLQAMAGGQYAIRNGLSFCFGVLGGKYVASPRLGGQFGFTMDFPDLWASSPRHSARHNHASIRGNHHRLTVTRKKVAGMEVLP